MIGKNSSLKNPPQKRFPLRLLQPNSRTKIKFWSVHYFIVIMKKKLQSISTINSFLRVSTMPVVLNSTSRNLSIWKAIMLNSVSFNWSLFAQTFTPPQDQKKNNPYWIILRIDCQPSSLNVSLVLACSKMKMDPKKMPNIFGFLWNNIWVKFTMNSKPKLKNGHKGTWKSSYLLSFQSPTIIATSLSTWWESH